MNNLIVTDVEGTTEPRNEDLEMPNVTYAKRKDILQKNAGIGMTVIHNFTEVLQILYQNFTRSKHTSLSRMPVKILEVKVKMKYIQFLIWDITVDIQGNNKSIIMEIDTGASVSIMSEETYKGFKSKFKLEPTTVKLPTYLGGSIPVLGRATVNVTYGKENVKLPLFVVKRKGPNLLGRDWISKIQLNWKEIFAVHASEDQPGLEETLSTYDDVFKDELAAIRGEGRLYKAQQIEFEEDSKQYITINTHKGLFQYNRLPFGVPSSAGIFQRTLDNIIQGIPNVLVRVDDILITGKDRNEHLKTLHEVLSCFKAGVRLNRQKCTFLALEVIYLGFKINKQGIFPVESKVKAISEAPRPTNVTELKAYLGMLNYYNRFLTNLSTLLQPLDKLLQKNIT
ncbi:unnamed protein product [Mytilus coruscus]|uniref:Peptidase A2 domain-containing protein n=1 Tax=Mytilus coruscus TaxID=42192 RepID=A0A6J8AGK9_MYTCO|nr:unnamed protein product [Mytilus coruscus]